MKFSIRYLLLITLTLCFSVLAQEYTVKSGDSLDRIARKFGVSVKDLIEENNLERPYRIYPGQKLKIPQTNYILHRVKYGENLSYIAKKYKVSVKSIIRANNLKKPYVIRVGQILKIPKKSGTSRTSTGSGERYCKIKHKVKKGESLITIAKKYRVWVKDIKRLNNIKGDTIRVGQILCIKEGVRKTVKKSDQKKSKKSSIIIKKKKIIRKKIVRYRVKPGDSLAKIAKKYGTTVSEIARLNGLKKPYVIYPGQRLKVPKKIVYIEEEIVKRKSVPFGFIWPVEGKIVKNFVNNSQMRHLGIDIQTECDTPVKAAEDGKVIFAGDSIKAYGRLIVIKHSNNFNTVYGHINQIHVKDGDVVKKGDTIGTAGSLNNSESCGIYFEIRKNTVPVDPLVFLNEKPNLDKKEN
ncbi:LysM peptidoglycan-binding domain-containing protein [Persephonella sp.]